MACHCVSLISSSDCLVLLLSWPLVVKIFDAVDFDVSVPTLPPHQQFQEVSSSFLSVS